MTVWLMRIVGSNGRIFVGDTTVRVDVPVYLESYNPEAQDGGGLATWTDNPNKAMKFESARAVLDCWSLQSVVCPLRPDGRPNRPLTAFSITPEKVEE